MVQRVWPRTEEGGRWGKLRGQSKFHCHPMLISSEHVFNEEEVAIEMRDFLSLMEYLIHHYHCQCGTPLMLCWVKAYSLYFNHILITRGFLFSICSNTTGPSTFWLWTVKFAVLFMPLDPWQLSPACFVILAADISSSTTITSLDRRFYFTELLDLAVSVFL